MADPVSYLLIEPGWEVVGSDGARVGEVREVLADLSVDIFDGLAVDVGIKSIRYVAAEHVAEIVEGRVILAEPADAAASLPEWRGTPGG